MNQPFTIKSHKLCFKALREAFQKKTRKHGIFQPNLWKMTPGSQHGVSVVNIDDVIQYCQVGFTPSPGQLQMTTWSLLELNDLRSRPRDSIYNTKP